MSRPHREKCSGYRYYILQNGLQGKVLGRRGQGRRKIPWLKLLGTWFSITTMESFRVAVNKVNERPAVMDRNLNKKKDQQQN